MSLTNVMVIMLSEICQSQKNTYYMILIPRNIQNLQIHRAGEWSRGYPGLGLGVVGEKWKMIANGSEISFWDAMCDGWLW